ncbi:MAG TPA: hypothetical protein VGN52_18545 [Burkholderiales bacterium]
MENAILRMHRDEALCEFAPGEHLLWSGRPPAGFMLRASDLYQIPFSVMWCGFAIFWESSVVRIHASTQADGMRDVMVLWGIPFVAIGLYMVAGRFLVDAWRRTRTRYALTNQRVIIISGLRRREVKSLPLRLLPDVTLTEQGERGTITFDSADAPARRRHPFAAWPGFVVERAFEHIRNARTVYRMIRQAQEEAFAGF